MKLSRIARTIPCIIFFLLILKLDAAAQQALHRFGDTHGSLQSLSFSKDGSLLVLSTGGTGAGNIIIYDANTGTQKATLATTGKTIVALSPDNNTLIAGNNNNELEVYNLQNGANAQQVSKRKLRAHINTIDFRADGRYYAIGTDDGRIAVMDAQHAGAFTTVMEAVPFINKNAGGNYTAVGNLRFIDNDRIMVFAQNGEVKAFDVNSGRQVYALEYYHNVIYAAADDEPVQCDVAAGAGRLLCSRSGNAFVLNLETYDIVGKAAQTGIRTSAIAPSGNLVLACDAANIYVYNGDLSHRNANTIPLTGFSGKADITKILISPAGNKVVICSGGELFIADYQYFQKLAAK